jgi:hypothetical protein
MPLTWAGSPLGELVLVQKASAAPGEGQLRKLATATRLIGSVLAAIAALCGLLLWRHLRERYR